MMLPASGPLSRFLFIVAEVVVCRNAVVVVVVVVVVVFVVVIDVVDVFVVVVVVGIFR